MNIVRMVLHGNLNKMNPNATDSYLESQVLTATPQKLRLMLIDGAIAAARQVLHFWEQDDQERATDAIVHCRNIVSELLCGIQPDNNSLTRKVAGVYVFLFQSLTEAQLRRDPQPVKETIEVLSVERETWRLVCEKMPHVPFPQPGQDDGPREITAAAAAEMLSAGTDEPPSAGLILDA